MNLKAEIKTWIDKYVEEKVYITNAALRNNMILISTPSSLKPSEFIQKYSNYEINDAYECKFDIDKYNKYYVSITMNKK